MNDILKLRRHYTTLQLFRIQRYHFTFQNTFPKLIL